MSMNKRLIEYNLPLADISEASAREKSIRWISICWRTPMLAA